jgi:hypothetical protein
MEQVFGARIVRGCTIIDTPPFFASSGREEAAQGGETGSVLEGLPPPPETGEPKSIFFWEDHEGPVVMVWDGIFSQEDIFLL